MAKIALLVIAATIALTSADGYGYGGRDDNAHYNFGYGVDDPHTQDHKSQHEERDGHAVTGTYTVKDADGTTRVVKYKSGPKSGFEAVVERMGHAKHPKSKYGKYGHDDEKYGYGEDGGSSYVGTTKWGSQGDDGYGAHEGNNAYGHRRQDVYGGHQKQEGYVGHEKQDVYGEHERKNIYGEHEKQDAYEGHQSDDGYGGHKQGKDEGYGDDGKVDGYGEHEKERVSVDRATEEGFEGRGY